MAFAEDLLKQAFLLLNKESKNPTQASLRRSVSTAYYALFHLLIQEASANWSRADTRDYLARAFEHRTMKQACTWAENATYDPAISPQVVARLRSVARAFRELQLQRHLQITATPQNGIGSKRPQKLTKRRPLLMIGNR